MNVNNGINSHASVSAITGKKSINDLFEELKKSLRKHNARTNSGFDLASCAPENKMEDISGNGARSVYSSGSSEEMACHEERNLKLAHYNDESAVSAASKNQWMTTMSSSHIVRPSPWNNWASSPCENSNSKSYSKLNFHPPRFSIGSSTSSSTSDQGHQNQSGTRKANDVTATTPNVESPSTPMSSSQSGDEPGTTSFACKTVEPMSTEPNWKSGTSSLQRYPPNKVYSCSGFGDLSSDERSNGSNVCASLKRNRPEEDEMITHTFQDPTDTSAVAVASNTDSSSGCSAGNGTQRIDMSSNESYDNRWGSVLHCMYPRQWSQEEVDLLLRHVDKWIPTNGKRQKLLKNDDSDKEQEEGSDRTKP